MSTRAERPVVNDINTHAWRLALTVCAAQELREEALRDAAKVLHDARLRPPVLAS
jgi:hypothetical protein